MTINIDAIKQAHPLPHIIESMTGQQIVKHKIHSILNQDSDPSLHVYDDGSWWDYSAGVGGDVIDFVGYLLFGTQYNPDTHFLDVVDRLGALNIQPLRTISTRNPKPTPKVKQRLSVSPDTIQAWHATMPAQRRAYWHSRKLTDTTIDYFRLGWDGKRYTIPAQYRGVWFGVKRRQSDVNDGIEHKYLSSKGSRVGIFNADILHGCERLIICEGEIDCMLLHQAGFDAVCSTGGASTWRLPWSEHLTHIPRVYVIFDNDPAGVQGARKVKMCVRRAKVVTLPQWYEDVGNFFEADPWPIEWLNENLEEA